MKKRYNISGQFLQDWNMVSELLEYFKGKSIRKFSNNDLLKICVKHTYDTFFVYKEMVKEDVRLNSENCELKERVRELEEENKKIKTGIVELNRIIS